MFPYLSRTVVGRYFFTSIATTTIDQKIMLEQRCTVYNFLSLGLPSDASPSESCKATIGEHTPMHTRHRNHHQTPLQPNLRKGQPRPMQEKQVSCPEDHPLTTELFIKSLRPFRTEDRQCIKVFFCLSDPCLRQRSLPRRLINICTRSCLNYKTSH